MAIRDLLADSVNAGVTPVIVGAPGMGKTAEVEAMCRQLDRTLITIIPAICDPTDIGGWQFVQDGYTRQAPPDWFAIANEADAEGKGSILFFDELSCATPAVQAACLRIILSGEVGHHKLPASCARMAAMNPPEQAAGGFPLSMPLANRLFFISYSEHFKEAEWCMNFPGYWGSAPKLPGIAENDWLQARALVAAFVKAKPHLLLNPPKTEEEGAKAWPSPRSWDAASRLIAASRSSHRGDEALLPRIAGCVGQGPAVEILTYLRDIDLPDPEVLLAHPEQFRVPGRADQIYAVISAVTAAAIANLTEPRWLAAWKVLSKVAEAKNADIAAGHAAQLRDAKGSKNLTLPTKEIAPFIPFLKKAGAMTGLR